MIKGERRQAILENLIYAIIWLILFVTPIIDKYSNYTEFDWNDVFRAWKSLVPLFCLFLIHNFVLLPFFLLRKKQWLYIFTLCVTVCILYLLNPMRRFVFPNLENRPFPERTMENRLPDDPQHRMMPSERDSLHIPPVGKTENIPPYIRQRDGFHPPADRMHEDRRPNRFRMPIMMRPYFNFIFLSILIIGLNLAIKLLFKSWHDDQRMKELERHNLRTELEYLKHQINPHFFMNTLNNIHALIDIDTEKAKDTVLELSKMMRYILYDSSQSVLPLKKEIRFLTNYIELMRIRYTENVDILVSMPEELPDVNIPPLLFVSFIENAFKHGVSYQHPSFIHISFEVKDKELHSLVINSSFNNSRDQHIGIGLENVRKRLHLLYGENYTLTIGDNNNEYHVLLIIPLSV